MLSTEFTSRLSRSEDLRLFIAIPLPPAVRDLVASLTTRLHDVRWVRDDQLHLTLRFLGDTPVGQIEPLCARLRAIRVEPFLLPVEGVGTFPPKSSPRVVWVGVGSGHPRLHQLRQKIDDAVLACGLTADLRTFHPHITLGRCQEGARNGVQQWLRHHHDFAGPSFQVNAFELFASELHSAGAVHHLLERFPLASVPATARPS